MSAGAGGERKRKAVPRINWRQSAIELASCAVFTLQTGKHLGRGSGVICKRDKNGKMVSVERWEEKFFDALETIGVVYDRKAYYAKADGKRRRP